MNQTEMKWFIGIVLALTAIWGLGSMIFIIWLAFNGNPGPLGFVSGVMGVIGIPVLIFGLLERR